jgi:hypothetical protein
MPMSDFTRALGKGRGLILETLWKAESKSASKSELQTLLRSQNYPDWESVELDGFNMLLGLMLHSCKDIQIQGEIVLPNERRSGPRGRRKSDSSP